MKDYSITDLSGNVIESVFIEEIDTKGNVFCRSFIMKVAGKKGESKVYLFKQTSGYSKPICTYERGFTYKIEAKTDGFFGDIGYADSLTFTIPKSTNLLNTPPSRTIAS
ncbi:MAG TPA: hypothetical protein VF273_09455 [Pelobium sp.]